MNRTNTRSYRRAATRQARTTNSTNTQQTPAVAGGFESLENRSLMSASALENAASMDRAMPETVDVSLQHAVAGASDESGADDNTDAAKADKRAERAAAKAAKKAATLAAKEERLAAKAEKAGQSDDAKADKQAAREANRAEKAALKAERKAERAQRKDKPSKAPSNAPQATTGNTVTGLTLVNARTNGDFVTLANGATVDLAQVGSRNISVRAEAGDGVESVSFDLDGEKMYTDNGGTFSLRGGKGSNYRGWRATNGTHTLTVTPHAKNGAKGEAGTPTTVSFTVTGANAKGGRNGFHQNPTPDTDAGTDTDTPVEQTPPSGGNGNGGGGNNNGGSTPRDQPAPTPAPTPAPAPAPAPVPSNPFEPAPSQPPLNSETPAQTNNVNNAITVAIENFSGTVTAADVGYFPVKANASGADIARVEFYANDQLIGAANAAPFMIGWQGVPQGSYTVVAKAIDSSGGYKLSESVKFNVVAAKQGQTITVTPGQSIQAAADRANPGDTVLVTAGTYKESVKVSRSGTADAPITFLFEDGAAIDAKGKTEAFIADGGSYIVVKGMEVKGADNGQQGQNAAVRTGDHWRLEDVEVHHVLMTGVGVMGNYVTLLRVNSHDNGQNGISSPKGKNVLMIDSKSINNNTDGHSPQSEGGGGKWARVNNVYITGFETANNTGPGLWFDINNTNIVLTNSTAHGNHYKDSDKPWQGSGFKTEINQGPIRFENNLTYDNTGAGMSIQESEHVTITGNTLRDDNIELRNFLRNDGDWKLDDVTITGNTFIGGNISTSSAGTKFGTNSGKDMHLTIDGNTYDAGGSFMDWSGKKFSSLKDLQDYGFEKNGHVESTESLLAKAA